MKHPYPLLEDRQSHLTLVAGHTIGPDPGWIGLWVQGPSIKEQRAMWSGEPEDFRPGTSFAAWVPRKKAFRVAWTIFWWAIKDAFGVKA